MRTWWFSCLALLSLPARAGILSDAVLAPPQAIVLADNAEPQRGARGRFAMQVEETGRVGGAVFLNSSSDYRSPDDLSIRLSPNVVAEIKRRYGESPETFFLNKTVTVDGTVRRDLIVNRSKYFRLNTLPMPVVTPNRWQHTVDILFAHQIVSVG